MTEFKQGFVLEPGVTRDLVAANPEYTITRMHMAKGVADPQHSHPHAQAVYMIAGRGLMALGDETLELKAGDCLQIPGGVPHGFALVEEDILSLEFFIPRREDIEKAHS